jgi:hypothetical protein
MEREIDNRKDVLEEKRREFEAKTEALKAMYNVEEKEISKKIDQAEQDLSLLMKDREIMSQERRSDGAHRAKK